MEWYQVKNKKKKQQRADASSIINFINKTREQTSLHPMLKSVLKVYWKTEQLINHIMIKYHKKSKKKIIWLKILPKILICVLKIQMTYCFSDSSTCNSTGSLTPSNAQDNVSQTANLKDQLCRQNIETKVLKFSLRNKFSFKEH